ncbi:MAG: hypothetical protein ACRCTA_02905, partial [Bacilli bacterium]
VYLNIDKASNLEIGNMVTFKSIFNENELLEGKALDNRIGCFMTSQIVEKHDNVSAIFTTSEEIGLKGIQALDLTPYDFIIVCDVVSNTNNNRCLNHGPIINLVSKNSVINLEILSYLKALSSKNQIPIQLDMMVKGNNEFSSIAYSKKNHLGVNINIAIVDAHTKLSQASVDDIKQTMSYLSLIINNLSYDNINKFKTFKGEFNYE